MTTQSFIRCATLQVHAATYVLAAVSLKTEAFRTAVVLIGEHSFNATDREPDLSYNWNGGVSRSIWAWYSGAARPYDLREYISNSLQPLHEQGWCAAKCFVQDSRIFLMHTKSNDLQRAPRKARSHRRLSKLYGTVLNKVYVAWGLVRNTYAVATYVGGNRVMYLKFVQRDSSSTVHDNCEQRVTNNTC